MTDFEMDVESAENYVETWSYEYRNAKTSLYKRRQWAKGIKQNLQWLRENNTGSYLLLRDFSDIV